MTTGLTLHGRLFSVLGTSGTFANIQRRATKVMRNLETRTLEEQLN